MLLFTPNLPKYPGDKRLGGSRRFDVDRWIRLFDVAVEEILAVDEFLGFFEVGPV